MNFEDLKVIFKQKLNFYIRYGGIFKKSFLDVVFHQDFKNEIKN